MTITLDNRDTIATIDTYQMFTGDSTDEMMRENMREDRREDYETVDIDYNMPAIIEALAHESIYYLSHELTTEKPQVVESITYVSHGSPKFYNFTTDYYIADYVVNIVELHNYIAANYDAVLEKCMGYARVYSIADITTEDKAHAGLCHYIDSVIEKDDYNSEIWEKEAEVYYENMTIKESK